MRTSSALLLPLALAGSTAAAAVKSSACSDLWDKAPKLLDSLEVYIARDYAGASLNRSTRTDRSRD